MPPRPLQVDLALRKTLRETLTPSISINRTAVKEAMMEAVATDADTPRCEREVPGIGTCPQPVVKIRVNGGRGMVASCVHCYWRSLGKCWACGALAPIDYDTDALCVPCRITYSTPAKWNGKRKQGETLDQSRARYESRTGKPVARTALKNRRST
jgi:hypothetical protein